MADYMLSCCSTADLTKEHFEERDIHYVCFHYAIDGQEYMDDLGVSMSFEEFYARMAKGADTRTSQVNISEYVTYFTQFLEKGLDIVHVSVCQRSLAIVRAFWYNGEKENRRGKKNGTVAAG